jgi:hypothetical protein
MADGDEPPFRYNIQHATARLIAIEYNGYMRETDREHLLRTEIMVRAAAEPVGLLYSVSGFTRFDRRQVSMHAELYERLTSRVTGVAVLNARTVIRFGATTVGLMSKTPLKTFDDRAEAVAWLESLREPARRRS